MNQSFADHIDSIDLPISCAISKTFVSTLSRMVHATAALPLFYDNEDSQWHGYVRRDPRSEEEGQLMAMNDLVEYGTPPWEWDYGIDIYNDFLYSYEIKESLNRWRVKCIDMLSRKQLTSDNMVLLHYLAIQRCHSSWKEAPQQPSEAMIQCRANFDGSVVEFIISFKATPTLRHMKENITAMRASLPPLLDTLLIQGRNAELARRRMSLQVAGLYREAARMKDL